MPAKHSHHIALTEPLADWAGRQVACGDYSSMSDLVRAAIRLLKAHQEKGQENSVVASMGPPKTSKLIKR